MLKIISEDGKEVKTFKNVFGEKEYIGLNMFIEFEEDSESMTSYFTKEQTEELIKNLKLTISEMNS